MVVTLEETPPHPTLKSIAAKKKDVKTGFMVGPFRTYTRRCLFYRLDACALSQVASAMSQQFIAKRATGGMEIFEQTDDSQRTVSVRFADKKSYTTGVPG